jgi:steroid delta-isomerase-like uncharacterized protein
MNPETMKSMTRRYCEELFSQGKLEICDELFSSDYVNLDPATPGGCVRGAAGMKQLVAGYREAFPDLVFAVQDQWSDGDTVVTRWTAQGTHKGPLMGIPATGRRGQPVDGITISRFENGKIVEQRAVWDALGLLRQLGVIPA